MRSENLLYLSQSDVVATDLTMAEIIDTLEVAFREKGEGRVEMPPKPGIHPGGGDNFIHAMPAYIPALHAAGLKWVSGFPDNSRKGLPYITGLLILNDPETGIPVAVMDCEWITAMRTGAATAVAAKRLARADSNVVGILACGVQGRTNLEALIACFPIDAVRAYDTDPTVSARFAEEMRAAHDIEIEVVARPQEAVTGCDLVVTSGPILKVPHATIRAGWLDEGSFASLVDFDSYWHPAALHECDKLCTDDLQQFHYYQNAGYFQDTPDIYSDLGELVAEQKPGRESPSERILAVNLGLALDDIAIAPLIYNRALTHNLGTWLPR